MLETAARLPANWEEFIRPYLDLKKFYKDLDQFLKTQDIIIPKTEQIFNVFSYMSPDKVTCVLYGEDPYPRLSSACGVAFWDKEITSWNDKTNGNSLKNILKALLVSENLASYHTNINECREIAASNEIKTPSQLFEHWLSQGVLLINTALTFSDKNSKTAHFTFWHSFHKALILSLNDNPKPYYILWGKKAQKWEKNILKSIDDKNRIIRQGHPTFIHQFLKTDDPQYSPFKQLATETSIKWL